MAGLGAGYRPPVHGAARTGAVGIGCGGGGGVRYGCCGYNGHPRWKSSWVSSGTLEDGAGQSCCKTTAGAGRGALGA